MRKLLAVVLAFLAWPAAAQWDPTKPAASSPTRQSQEIRANWAALAQTVAGVNLVADNSFLLWSAGDSASPTMYQLVVNGGTGTVARTGTGLADTNNKFGDFAALVTGGTNAATLYQDLLSSTSVATSGLIGLSVSCGAWVKSSTTPDVEVCVYAAAGAEQTCSASHTGNGTWQWLSATHLIPASVDRPSFFFNVPATGSAYFSGPTCVIGSVPPSYPQPSGWENFAVDCFRAGAQTTGTDKVDCHWQSPYYGIVQDVSLWAGTAPVGAALIVSVSNWDGAAYTGLHGAAARPRIADGATRSDTAEPNSAYARRIIVPQHGTTQAVGGELAIGIDQIGSGTAGSDLRIQIRGIRVARPLQQFLQPTE